MVYVSFYIINKYKYWFIKSIRNNSQNKKVKSKIPINSYEGYIRQLFWREYQRYTYIHFDFNKTNILIKELTKEMV